MESRITRHEPLYLKYRPQCLADLVGQEAVTRTLGNAITFERLTHAYLFTGPRGTGKTSSARILAKSLNCERSDKATLTPCQECAPCKEIKAGTSPAVMEIDAASNNSVDDARLLIERAPLKAVGGRYKIYIIDECHMLTKEAFNALLKTIEQPPPDVVFILATTEEHKVLPTIISRCQRLMFRNADQDILAAHLRSIADKESIEIEDEALRVIARRSGGGLRDALSTLDQASLLGAPGQPVLVNDLLRLLGALHEDVQVQISEKILAREGNGLLQSIGALLSEGREPSVLARELAGHFLNLAKASYLAETPKCTVEMLRSVVLGSDQYLTQLLAQAPKYERSELAQIIEALDRLEATCRRTTQPTMHLEMGLLSICHRHDMLLVRELSDRVAQLEAQIQAGGGVSRPQQNEAPAGSRAPMPQRSSAPAPAPAQSHSGSSSSGGYSAPASPPPQTMAPRSADSGSPAQDQPRTAPAPQASEHVRPAASDEQYDRQPEPQVGTQDEQQTNMPEPEVATNQNNSTPSHSSEETIYSDEPGAGSGGASGDMEADWSRILDELHRINIPTHGLFNSRVAFLIDLNDREITFGVKNPGLQKTLEAKAPHLKGACKAVTGRDLEIRVKVSADARPVVASTASTRRPPPPSGPSGGESNHQGSGGSGGAGGSGYNSPPPRNDAPVTVGGGGVIDNLDGGGKAEFDNGAVKEAYKLFEGPGSRRIQPPG